MQTYYIGGGLLGEAIEVQLEGPPPCLWCGDPVLSPSCDGPMVCAPCDMGRNKDGSVWAAEGRSERREHFRSEIKKYRMLHAERKAAIELAGPPLPAYLVELKQGRWELRDTLPLLPEKGVPATPGWVIIQNEPAFKTYAAGSKIACEAAARLQHRYIAATCPVFKIDKNDFIEFRTVIP